MSPGVLLNAIIRRALAGIEDEGGLWPAAKKSLRLLRYGGPRGLLLGESPYLEAELYREWAEGVDRLSAQDILNREKEIAQWADPPTFSILLPIYKTPLPFLRAAIQSVRDQIYPHWELCISDDCSNDPKLTKALEALQSDPKIKLHVRQTNGHISANSNSALGLATNDWVVLLDHDDQLSADALYELASAIRQHPAVKLLYSDEDKIDKAGRRSLPHFKPAFNLELLRSNNYICHITCAARQEILAVDGFTLGTEGAQDHDLVLKLCERLDRSQIHHIPKVLYHWRLHANSTSAGIGIKAYAIEAGRKAVSNHLERCGIAASVTGFRSGYQRVEYAIPGQAPSVSIVIPSRDNLCFLRRCLSSLRDKTTYLNYDVTVVDNGTTDEATLEYLASIEGQAWLTVLRDDGPFNFSRLNNLAVEQSASDFICMLNDDTEVLDGSWLSRMVSLACQKDVGAVGAKLLYEDDTVQHAGVFLGVGGVATHPFLGMDASSYGYNFRLGVSHEFPAVTGACLLVSREKYLEVDGLNEQLFAVAYNDVDFCLKLQSRGYRNVVCSDALLRHFESATRGSDETSEKAARLNIEALRLAGRWWHHVKADVMYNTHLSQIEPSFKQDYEFSPRKMSRTARQDFRFGRLLADDCPVPEETVLKLQVLCRSADEALRVILTGPGVEKYEDALLEVFPDAVIDQEPTGTQNGQHKATGDESTDNSILCSLVIMCGVPNQEGERAYKFTPPRNTRVVELL